MNSSAYLWYQTLVRPWWAPPAWLFGPVWILLYAIIAITFGAVFYKVATKRLPRSVAVPFVLNLVFNFAFTPIQFGLRNNTLALLDIVLVLATLVWAIFSVRRRMRAVALANIPYLGWVLFATALELSIVLLNG